MYVPPRSAPRASVVASCSLHFDIVKKQKKFELPSEEETKELEITAHACWNEYLNVKHSIPATACYVSFWACEIEQIESIHDRNLSVTRIEGLAPVTYQEQHASGHCRANDNHLTRPTDTVKVFLKPIPDNRDERGERGLRVGMWP